MNMDVRSVIPDTIHHPFAVVGIYIKTNTNSFFLRFSCLLMLDLYDHEHGRPLDLTTNVGPYTIGLAC